MPDVSERLKLKYEINYYNTKFLTGHCNFRSYLHSFGLSENNNWRWCNVVDIPEHNLYDCWRYTDKRINFFRELSEIGIRLDISLILRNTEGMTVFNETVKKIEIQ